MAHSRSPGDLRDRGMEGDGGGGWDRWAARRHVAGARYQMVTTVPSSARRFSGSWEREKRGAVAPFASHSLPRLAPSPGMTVPQGSKYPPRGRYDPFGPVQYSIPLCAGHSEACQVRAKAFGGILWGAPFAHWLWHAHPFLATQRLEGCWLGKVVHQRGRNDVEEPRWNGLSGTVSPGKCSVLAAHGTVPLEWSAPVCARAVWEGPVGDSNPPGWGVNPPPAASAQRKFLQHRRQQRKI